MPKTTRAKLRQTKSKKYMLVRYSHMNTLGRFEHQETSLPKMSTRVVVKTEKGLEGTCGCQIDPSAMQYAQYSI